PVRKALKGSLRNAVRGALQRPEPTQAHSYVLIDCPLTEDEYEMPPIRVRANQFQRLVLDLENPLEKTLASVHICYKEFDLFYMPWRHKAKPKDDPVTGGYYYYWLTDRQRKELEENKPQTVRFILNGRRCGEHDLFVVWG